MAQIQAGSTTALDLLYDRYCDRAYRVALSVCCDDGRAEEAVQEAFVSIWRARATHRWDRGAPAAWLLTLVRRRALEAARRDALPAGPDDTADPIQARPLHDLLTLLPDAQREAITLAFHGGLTHVEIAEQLRLQPGTVKSRMRLGLHKLRHDLKRTGT